MTGLVASFTSSSSVVEIVAVDRQAGRRAAADDRQQIAQRCVGGDGNQFGAGNHHLTGGQIGEAEDAVEHLLLLFFEHAGLLARRHQHLEFFFRMHHPAMIRAAQAEQFDHGLRRAVHQPDERPEHAHEQFQRPHQPDRRRFRTFERDPFRRQLAEHDLRRGDDRECDRHGDAVRGGGGEMRGQKDSAGSKIDASAGSAIQPRPRLAIVMPSCVAAM